MVRGGRPRGRPCLFRLTVVPALVLAVPAAVLCALPAPGWLDGTTFGFQVRLLWMPVPGASRYAVYHDGTKVAEVEDYGFEGGAPADEGIHLYEVCAVGEGGVEGGRSQPARITVAVFPHPPPHLRCKPETLSPKIRIRWGGVRGAAAYHLYRAESRNGPFMTLAAGPEFSFTDSRMKYDRTYWYAVSPLDGQGMEGERSEPVGAVIARQGPC